MKVKMLEPCLIGGKEHYQGKEYDLDDITANSMVLMKRAEFIDDMPKDKGGLTTNNTKTVKGKK